MRTQSPRFMKGFDTNQMLLSDFQPSLDCVSVVRSVHHERMECSCRHGPRDSYKKYREVMQRKLINDSVS